MYKELFKNYIQEINSKIQDLINFKKIKSEIKTELKDTVYIYSMNCMKNDKHVAYYDPTLNIFYCPHCGYSSTLIELTADILNIPEEEALYQILVKRLKYKPSSLTDLLNYIKETKKQYDIFYEMNSAALELFKKNFETNQKARDYAYNTRGLTQKTIDKFEIGSTGNENIILNELSKKYPKDKLVEVGLLGYNKDNDTYYDVFRNRLMFPIHDDKNRVIAFGGRTLNSSPKKYLNTKTTPIFQKGTALYGINHLEKGVEYNKILVSEGYMDVVTMKQNGIENVVGNLGTAITKNHLRVLSQYTSNPTVMLDGDEAGQNAMIRTITKVEKVDTVTLPNNLDPDEYLKEYSPSSLINCINKNIKSWDEAMVNVLLKEDVNIFENLLLKKEF